MKATRQLHELGQSLWLDNITRALLTSGTLSRYLRDFAVTGLTSNPTIFDQAIQSAGLYDEAIRKKAAAGKSGEALFFELALEDLTRAADLFAPIHDATEGVDGWVSLEVSPLLADDPAGTVKAAVALHAQAQRRNLFIKIPGTRAGAAAIEEAIFAGVPVNVTLLFSREHYLAAAEAYLRGIERRVAAGRDPRVGSVASLFVSRWDVAVKDKVPAELRNRLGIAVAMRTYKAYRELLASPRWQKLAAARCPTAAPLLGQHRDQGPHRRRCALHRGARGSGYGQHHAGEDAARLCRSRKSKGRDAARRRRCGGGACGVCSCRCRHRRPGH